MFHRPIERVRSIISCCKCGGRGAPVQYTATMPDGKNWIHIHCRHDRGSLEHLIYTGVTGSNCLRSVRLWRVISLGQLKEDLRAYHLPVVWVNLPPVPVVCEGERLPRALFRGPYTVEALVALSALSISSVGAGNSRTAGRAGFRRGAPSYGVMGP